MSAATENRKLSTVPSEDEESDKISELAKSSVRKEKGTWMPAIPLLVLAPLLVLISLVGVVVPVSDASKCMPSGTSVVHIIQRAHARTRSFCLELPRIRRITSGANILIFSSQT